MTRPARSWKIFVSGSGEVGVIEPILDGKWGCCGHSSLMIVYTKGERGRMNKNDLKETLQKAKKCESLYLGDAEYCKSDNWLSDV
jgi:hypothetical protein